LALLGGGFFLILFAVTLGQNVGISVLLERHGASYLPRAFVANAIVLAVLSYAATRSLARFPLRAVMVMAFAVAAVGVGGVIYALDTGVSWAPIALYVVGFATADMSLVLFWSMANRAYDTRDAKRLFPLVSAAGTAGASLSGFFGRWLISAAGMSALLWTWAAFMAACAVWSYFLTGRTSEADASTPASSGKAPPEETADRTLRHSMLTGLMLIVAVTLFGRYLYGRALRIEYTDDESLAAMNGLLIGVANAVTFLLQLFVTSRLLSRLGVGLVGLVYPLCMVAAFAGMFVAFGTTTAIACLFAIISVRQGVQGVVENIFYSPLPRETAARTMTLVTAIGMPLGMLAAGIGLQVLTGAPAHTIAAIGLAVTVSLIIAATMRSRAYTAALKMRLLKGGSDVRVRLAQVLDDANATVESILIEDLSPEAPDLLERLRTLIRSQEGAVLAQVEGRAVKWKERSALGRIVDSRIRESYRLHEALDGLPHIDGFELIPSEVGDLLGSAIRQRLGENVAIILAALHAGTHLSDFDRISLRVMDADRRVRAAAVEMLDDLMPEVLRPLILPLIEQKRLAEGKRVAAERYAGDREEVAANPIGALLDVPDDWIRATTAYLASYIKSSPYAARLEALAASGDSFVSFAAGHALAAARA
jgi:hypothetical protein